MDECNNQSFIIWRTSKEGNREMERERGEEEGNKKMEEEEGERINSGEERSDGEKKEGE